jgi:hypothetical protein
VDRANPDRLLRFWAARLAGASRRQALVKGTLVALIGAGLIVLKSLVH